MRNQSFGCAIASLSAYAKMRAIVSITFTGFIPIVVSSDVICREDVIANQLCLLRGVYPICNDDLFGPRDAFGAAHIFGIKTGKLVIVDDEKISLRILDSK